MSNFAYDKFLSGYTDNPMVKVPLDQARQKTLVSILELHFEHLPESEMNDIVGENYRLMAVLLRLKTKLSFRQKLESNEIEKYYASFRKRNKYNDWIEVYKTEITALSVFLTRYFVGNLKSFDQSYRMQVQDLMEYIRYIHSKKKELYEIEKNPFTFTEDIDVAIEDVNRQVPAYGRVSYFLLTLFAVIIISNLALAMWFTSFGLLFWGTCLLSTLLPVAAYRGLKILIASNDEKEKLNGWKTDILVKEKMDDIIISDTPIVF